jgi:hypothetical protein
MREAASDLPAARASPLPAALLALAGEPVRRSQLFLWPLRSIVGKPINSGIDSAIIERIVNADGSVIDLSSRRRARSNPLTSTAKGLTKRRHGQHEKCDNAGARRLFTANPVVLHRWASSRPRL